MAMKPVLKISDAAKTFRLHLQNEAQIEVFDGLDLVLKLTRVMMASKRRTARNCFCCASKVLTV